ncbi:MAG: Ger(x)C family spore germination protein [Solibacillus sp.]
MKKGMLILIVLNLWLLTGCWDVRLLKDNSLVVGMGLDVEDDDKVMNTSVIRQIKQNSGGTGKPATSNVIYSAVGNTLRETRSYIEKQLGGKYASNKMQVLVLGEDLAGEDILPIIDVFYRDPRNSLGAKLVVAEGTAKELLNMKMSEDVFISEKIFKALIETEEQTLIPGVSIQSVCPDLFDPGIDFALPYIKTKNSDTFDVAGMALFHDTSFTGTVLEGEDGTVLLYLNGEHGASSTLSFNVNPEEEQRQNQFITTNAFLKDQKLKVKVDKSHNVSVEINVKLNVTVVEYPKDHLFDHEKETRLNKEISKQLTEKAEKVIEQLQKANCDYFGIGRQLIAFHPETWKEIDWPNTFPSIDIKPKIEVEITGTGILK